MHHRRFLKTFCNKFYFVKANTLTILFVKSSRDRVCMSAIIIAESSGHYK